MKLAIMILLNFLNPGMLSVFLYYENWLPKLAPKLGYFMKVSNF